MTHMLYTGPIIDAHAHIFGHIQHIDTVQEIERQHGYNKTNVLSTQAMLGCADNARCLLYKLKYPQSYMFASLNHNEENFEAQAKQMLELGADGFKMIEGKPTVYKALAKPLNHKSYNGFYTLLSEKEIPLLMHVGDPEHCWNTSGATQWEIEHGYVYVGEGYPSLEELYLQVEDIATRFPKLQLILAHFFFMANTLERAQKFLEQYPNISFDICPGTEMYVSFANNISDWRSFFIRNSTRLIFGTDNFYTDNLNDADDKQQINRMIHCFLQTEYPFSVWDLQLKGIALDSESLENIYYKNFERLAKTPRLVDKEGFADYCTRRAKDAHRLGGTSSDEQELLEIAQIAKQRNG